jgi:hypothetical protein
MRGKVLQDLNVSYVYIREEKAEPLTISVRVRRPFVSMRNKVGIVETT